MEEEFSFHTPEGFINFNEISKIDDLTKRAYSYIKLGTDALNCGEFTLSIDSFLEALNCCKVNSLPYLIAQERIAKQLQVLGHPDECIKLNKQIEEVFVQKCNEANAPSKELINNRITNLCLMLDSLVRVKDLDTAKNILDLIIELSPDESLSLYVITAKVQYYGGIHDNDKERYYLDLYITKVKETYIHDSQHYQKINEMLTFLLMSKHFDRAKELIDLLDDAITHSNNQSCKLVFLTNKIAYDKEIGDTKQLNEDILQFHFFVNLQIKNGIYDAYENTKYRINMSKIRNEQKRIHAENIRLQKEAMTDSLVKLPNRGALDIEGHKLFKKAKTTSTNFAVEILDIDYFKQLNDTYGHQFGDKALVALSRCLKKIQHDNVFISRYGGDEFCILYFNLSADKIKKFAKLINIELKKIKIPNNNSKVSPYLTISQGIFIKVPSEKDNLWDFIKKADSALYDIKKTKRGSIKIRKL
ncbi:GGDEF domain-containing protein [Lachnobacterium bovis]|uniref:Diguanylate cyclase (GGDEF) domain-containing protein n=1 Tax=Lachnobacterium bovis TaxID=140626 RepID=A0A1H9S170_9FIRM|nr:GGDEF domain-containing protein [Lachnobacterium bovis]SER78751.1 diguanylate cyclase (GGDEF) domain-containing protein [Lachnobacterium bovis]